MIKQIPLSVLVKRGVKKVLPKRKLNYHLTDKRTLPSNFSLIRILKLEGQPQNKSKNVDHYLSHEFNFLGSNWYCFNGKNKEVLSVHSIKSANVKSLVSEGYKFINWQLDFRTGFEFDVTQPFYNQQKDSGVDVKNCWELGRLQWLPQLALNGSQESIEEVQNVVLDFICSNPIGMGVQWMCAMDVGIRVSNVLVALDLIWDNVSDEVREEILGSVYQHGKFIYDNLEYKEGAGGNHYLFNLVGLLFVGNYIKGDDEVEKWRAFAEKEILAEFDKQFFKDGGNFEGSTTYHCLSAEAIVYSIALLLRRNIAIPDSLKQKLNNAGQFIDKLTKPNGEIPQFGDNDSGRLFKFSNEDDNLLEYKSLLACFNGLFEDDFISNENSINSKIIQQLANQNKLKVENKSIGVKFKNKSTNYSSLTHQESTELTFGKSIELSDLELIMFNDFGVFGLKSSEFYLMVSAICNKNMHHSWGHVHCDKLAFDLQVNGKNLVRDPGSYCYTSNGEQRNLFRSSKAHNGIVVEGFEQGKMFDLFYLEPEVEAKLIEATSTSLTLQANYYGVKHIRKFTVQVDKLIVEDYCNKPFQVNINKFREYSPNYGVKEIND